MLATLGSAAITLAIVVGMPLAVAAAAVLATMRRTGPALTVVAIVAAIAVIGVSAWAVYRGPTQSTAGAGPPGPIAPPGSGPTAAPPGPVQTSCQPNGTRLTQTASQTSFQQKCLAAPAGRPFTIRFTNSDPGTMHDIHILSADPAQEPGARSFFMGEIITGPATVTYQVAAIQAGTFFFHCDVHPTLMFGTFVAG